MRRNAVFLVRLVLVDRDTKEPVWEGFLSHANEAREFESREEAEGCVKRLTEGDEYEIELLFEHFASPFPSADSWSENIFSRPSLLAANIWEARLAS